MLQRRAAALPGLFTVCEGTEIVSAAVLIAQINDFDQMDGAAAAKHEFVSDLLLLDGSASSVFAGSGSSHVPGCLHVPLLLVSWFLEFW